MAKSERTNKMTTITELLVYGISSVAALSIAAHMIDKKQEQEDLNNDKYP